MKGIQGRSGRGWFSAAVFVLGIVALALTLGVASAQEDTEPGPLGLEAAGIIDPEARLTSGVRYACWLRLDGSAECWGDNSERGDFHTGPFQRISAGSRKTCGVRLDGTLTCWGDNYAADINVELGGPYAAVSVGPGRTCALRPDGSGYCWQVHENQILDAEIEGGPFVQVSAGGGWGELPGQESGDYACGLKTDGSILCWGNNRFGQAVDLPGPFTRIDTGVYHTCGLRPNGSADCWGASEAYSDKGQAADQPGPFGQIALGEDHTCGLKLDGSVDCWGSNQNGQAQDQPGPFTQITAADRHTCGRRPDGSVDCWGTHGEWWENSEVGDMPIPFVRPVEGLAASNAHTCGLRPNGSVNCWGAVSSLYNYGQAADQLGPFAQVTAGWWHTCGLRPDRSAHCWGDNDDGAAGTQAGPFLQLVGGSGYTCGLRLDGSVDCWGQGGGGSMLDQAGPFVQISGGSYHACGLKPDGKVNCWGSNINGQAVGQNGPFLQVSAGAAHTCALNPDGRVVCWGLNVSGQATNQVGPFAMVDAGSRHTCALKPDGSALCWGDNNKGQTAAQPGPFLQIAAGFEHSCGRKADGTIICWGRDNEGQTAGQPDRFGLLAFPTSRVFSAGFRHTCGLRPNGSVDCWGDNTYGQAEDRVGPFTQVSAGGHHTCALRPDGSADCWGNNERGQAADQTGPFTMISAGGAHTCALRADGRVDCWGTNDWGESDDKDGPFVEISVGGAVSMDETEWSQSCGLRADGSVDCWGGDMFAWPYVNDTHFSHIEAAGFQTCGLGLDGSITCWQSPYLWYLPAIHLEGAFSQVSGGLTHGCGLKATGGVQCWGENEHGQTDAPSGNYSRISAGGYHTCALVADGSVDCWGGNEYGQAEDQVGPFGPYVPTDYEPPVAANDAYTVDQRQRLSVSAPGVMSNDEHQADYPIAAWLVADVAHGNLTLDSSGAFTYIPDDIFNGTDTFTYKVNDGNADSNVATVTINVRAVYDPPVTISEKLYAMPSPNDETYPIDSWPTLDTYRYNSDGPIEFAFDIGRVVGRTDENGYLKDVDWLISKGIVPAKVTLSVLAFDVDTTYAGTDVRPERNKVYVNGHYVGDLTGRNNDWKQTHIQVDVRHIRFAVPQCDEGSPTVKPIDISKCTDAPTTSRNTVRIDIDADNNRKAWGIGVDSAVLWFDAARPILLVHGRGGSKPGDDPCSVPDAGEGCTYWDENDGEYYFGFRGLLNEAGFLTLHMENFLGQDAPATHALIIKRVVQQMKVRYGVHRINIVAHSKGGLDSRAYVSDFTLNPNNDVESLFTIATPHFGSFMAALSWGASWLVKEGEYEYTDAMDSLREINATTFTATHPARAGVHYYVAYAESGRWCVRLRWSWWFGFRVVLVRCAEFEQSLALPEAKQRLTSPVVYDILLHNGLFPGGNDFMVTETSANLLLAPGHTRTNTTIVGPKDLNHHSIAAALDRHNKRDMSIINFISQNLRANAPTAAGVAGAIAPQVTQAVPQVGTSSLGMQNGEIAEGQLLVKPVGIDAVTSASFLLSWEVGDLYLSLVDPSGRVINASTDDPKITYEEARTAGEPYTEFLPGKYAVFTIIEPPYGEWQAKITAAGQLPGDRANWVVTVVQDSDITLALTPDATWQPLNGTVKLRSKLMVEDAPLVGATVTCTVVRPDGTTQAVALLDDGAHNDGAAGDGVYGNSFVGSQYGRYSLLAKATGTSHEIPFLRTAFSEVQFGSGTARISGTFSDRGVDTDGDGLFNTLQVDVPVQVTTAGEYAAFAELRSASGGVLAYSNATADLTPGQRKLTFNFSGEEIWANGGNGRFTLADLRLNDMGADGGPLQIDFKPAPYTTANYTRDQFQHAAAGLTGVTRDYGVDTNGNGKYDELVVEVEVYLEAGGAYSWSGRLVDGAGHELSTDGGELTLEAGLRTITFRFDGRDIGTSQRHGPYHLVAFDLWGDGAFLSTDGAATTAFYNYRLFEGAPPTVELYLPAISR